jgi:hypothetical protein
MKRFIRTRPRPGTIIAIVALIVALAGTAVAAGPFLPKSKFSNFKKNVAVKGPITYVNQTQSVDTSGGGGSAQTITAQCPSGFFPVGGSAKSTTPSQSSNFFLFQDYPSANGWTAQVYVNGPPSETVIVNAICEKAKTSGTPPSITQ